MSDENENMDAQDNADMEFLTQYPPPKSEEELRRIRNLRIVFAFVCLVLLIGYGVYYVASTDICEAARNGENWVIKIHLLFGADINTLSQDCKTPLIEAIVGARENTVQLLLENGADPNLTQPGPHFLVMKDTPLHWICGRVCDSDNESERCNIARMLIEYGADVDVADEFGYTPLHRAAINDYPQLAELLIEHGADVNALSMTACTPLQETEYNNAEKTRAVLIEHGGISFEEITKQPLTPKITNLYLAQIKSRFYFSGTSELIRHYPELVEMADKDTGMQFLHYCVYHNSPYYFSSYDFRNTGDPELSVLNLNLRKLDVNVLDKDGKTPLDLAIEIKNEEAIDILKKAGAKTDEELKKEAAQDADENNTDE